MKNAKPVVVFTDPPANTQRNGRAGKYFPHLDIVKERPGEWACIFRTEKTSAATSAAANIRNGKNYVRFAKPGRFEAIARATGEGDTGVWVRYHLDGIT